MGEYSIVSRSHTLTLPGSVRVWLHKTKYSIGVRGAIDNYQFVLSHCWTMALPPPPPHTHAPLPPTHMHPSPPHTHMHPSPPPPHTHAPLP